MALACTERQDEHLKDLGGTHRDRLAQLNTQPPFGCQVQAQGWGRGHTTICGEDMK